MLIFGTPLSCRGWNPEFYSKLERQILSHQEQETVRDRVQDKEAFRLKVVTIQAYAHWNCPECNSENAEQLASEFPCILTCKNCQLRVTTLVTCRAKPALKFVQGFFCLWASASEESGLRMPVPARVSRDLERHVIIPIVSRAIPPRTYSY